MRRMLALLAMLAVPAAAQTSRVTAGATATDSLVVKVGTSYLSGVTVTSGATAGYVMIFDSATVPADGTVAPRKCLPLAANTGIALSWTASPLYFQNGATVVFSSTGCFTKTASATAFISGDIQ